MTIRDSNDPNVIRIVAPAGGVTGGTLVLIGTILVLPLGSARAGYLFDAVAAGPMADAPAATGEAWTPGDSLYWDNTALDLTKTSTSNTQCGYATKAKASADSTGAFCMTTVEGTDGTGSTADITDGSVTLAKMADLAQDKFIVRTTTSTGVPQTATCTAAGRALIDDADAAAQRTTLGLGNVATRTVGTTTGTAAAGDDAGFTRQRSIGGFINSPLVKSITLERAFPHAATIVSLVSKLVSGTVTISIKINGTAVTGISGVTLTSAGEISAATALKTLAANDVLTMDITAISAPVDFDYSLLITETR